MSGNQLPPIVTEQRISSLRDTMGLVQKGYSLSADIVDNFTVLKKYSEVKADICIDRQGNLHLLEQSQGIYGVFLSVINFLKKCYYNLGIVLFVQKWPSTFLMETAPSTVHQTLKVCFFQFLWPQSPDFLDARRQAFLLREKQDNQTADQLVCASIRNLLDTERGEGFRGRDLLRVLEHIGEKIPALGQKLRVIPGVNACDNHYHDRIVDPEKNQDLARITRYFVNARGDINPFWLERFSAPSLPQPRS